MSNPRPRNTKTTPTHCRERRGCENINTDPRIVKNFLVVVNIEHVRGPKCVMVRKIKFCMGVYLKESTCYNMAQTSNV